MLLFFASFFRSGYAWRVFFPSVSEKARARDRTSSNKRERQHSLVLSIYSVPPVYCKILARPSEALLFQGSLASCTAGILASSDQTVDEAIMMIVASEVGGGHRVV